MTLRSFLTTLLMCARLLAFSQHVLFHATAHTHICDDFFPRPDVMVINFPGIHNQQFSSRRRERIHQFRRRLKQGRNEVANI